MLRSVFALIITLAWLGFASAQQTLVPPMPGDLPPLGLLPVQAEAAPLPNGTTVSQPLQESLPDSLLGPSSPRVYRKAETPRGPMPQSWYSGEVLLLWSKAQHIPPLLVGNRFGPPSVYDPNTVLLMGGRKADPSSTTGAKFTLGWSVGPQTGMEIAYLFTGTQTSNEHFGPSRWNLARPLINANTGIENPLPVNGPMMPGTFQAWSSNRVQSWGITGLANLYSGESLRIHATGGYKYFMLNEGLRFEQYTAFQGIDSSYRASSTDQIDTANRFHGAELGLRSEMVRGPFSLQLETKVALGKSVEVVRVSGQTVAVTEGIFGSGTQWYSNGVFGQPSNSGRTSLSHFAVLPEGGVKLGYQLGERARFSVGYTVVYLSDAVRPGDQIDRTVDWNASGDRPLPLFVRSDYWIQGLTLGLDWRY